MGVFGDITEKFIPFESWFYYRFIGSQVLEAVSPLFDELLPTIIGFPKGAQILDVGCGAGHAIHKLACRFPDIRLIGLDVSKEMIGYAEKQNRHFGDRVQFVQAGATEIPFTEGFFDLVMSIGSIKHWPDKERGLSECLRVLGNNKTFTIAEAYSDFNSQEYEKSFENFGFSWLIRRTVQEILKYRVFKGAPKTDDFRSMLMRQSLRKAKFVALKKLPIIYAIATKGSCA